MKLSIVATLYKSAPYLQEFHRRASAAAVSEYGQDYQIILVNDGSPDDSLEKAIQLTEADDKVVVVDLSRNFGHHKAMMSGLANASGDHIFLIDSDLEEEPEWLHGFHQLLKRNDCDVAFGVQKERRGNFMERLTGRIFYRLFRLLTRVAQPNNIVTARLMTKRYVDALLLHTESEINIGGLWLITGFRQCQHLVDKHNLSDTTYSFSKKLSHLVNAVTSFSSAPLVLTFYVGLLMSFFSGLFVLQLVFRYFFLARPLDGYTSLIASIWLLAGLIILFIGVQGVYLSKIFSEVKNRPNVIVRKIYGKPKSSQKPGEQGF